MTRLNRTLRGRNALLNVFELWVALAGILTGIFFYIDRDALHSGALSRQIGSHLADVWSVGYFLAGISVAYGLLKPSPRVEILGLSVLGSATAVNGIAILAVFHGRGVGQTLTLLTLTAAAWVRSFLVYQAAHELAKGQGYESARS